MAFEIIQDLWIWYTQDIIGHELIAGILLFAVMFMMFTAMNIPNRVTLAFMIPVSIGFIANAYLSWFGWLLIGFAGITFGLIVYAIYER